MARVKPPCRILAVGTAFAVGCAGIREQPSDSSDTRPSGDLQDVPSRTLARMAIDIAT